MEHQAKTARRRLRVGANSMRTIKQMASLAGVSARTLRYYESVGLLHPTRNDAGYRLYSDADARRLAQVLAMRACGLPLATIRRLCSGEATELLPAMRDHLVTLEQQRTSTMAAIERTRAAIDALERIDTMGTEDSFERMKREGLARFEGEFGQEARERYGNAAIEASNERLMSLTKDEWDAKELLEDAIKVQLRIAMAQGDAEGAEARELAHMHRRWITIHWGEGYAEEAYLGLVRGYLADPRFVEYYDSAAGEGATEFLVQAVEAAMG